MIVAHAIMGRMPRTRAMNGKIRLLIGVPFKDYSAIDIAMSVPSQGRI